MIFAGSNKTDTRVALSLSIFINAMVLLLAFLFLRWTVQDPPPADQTVELNMADFGFANSGANQNDGATQTQNVAEESPTEEAVVDDNSQITQNVQDTPSQSTQQTQTQTQNQTQQTQQQTQQTSSALNNLLNNMNNGGDGEDGENNDEGNPNGNIDGKGVFGDGSGWSLSGRNLVGEPRFNGSPTKNGVVQVRITVGKDGKVRTAKVVHSAPTNTSEQSLFNLAIQAAKTATFNNDSGAAINQSGTITFVFKVS